jgi:DNA polymerase
VSDAASRLSSLEILRTEVAGCRACVHLAEARTNTVFGSGNPAARLCFLGEAPGAYEDASGEPFVGRAGQLLTKIIEACTLTRDEVYILNVLKCRPPENRRPEPEEVANCRGYFERQIEAIRPEFICCLGTSAAQSLLRTDETIGKLRGRWFEYGPATVICTYHPSYLLRNPAAKRDVWDDMQHLMARMGIEMPQKGPGG